MIMEIYTQACEFKTNGWRRQCGRMQLAHAILPLPRRSRSITAQSPRQLPGHQSSLRSDDAVALTVSLKMALYAGYGDVLNSALPKAPDEHNLSCISFSSRCSTTVHEPLHRIQVLDPSVDKSSHSSARRCQRDQREENRAWFYSIQRAIDADEEVSDCGMRIYKAMRDVLAVLLLHHRKKTA